MMEYAILGPRPHPYPDHLAKWRLPLQAGPMPRPRVLILQEQLTDDAIVYDFAADGEFSGDTWFYSVLEAKSALFEGYGQLLSKWHISHADDINDAAQQALLVAREAKYE